MVVTGTNASSHVPVAAPADLAGATSAATAEAEDFRLYTPLLATVAAYLPWVILAFALAATVIFGADVMFISGLLAASLAGFLVSALGSEVPEVLAKIWGRQLLAARGQTGVGLDTQFREFLARFERTANSHWSWVLGFFFAVAAVPQIFLSSLIPDPLGVYRRAGLGGLVSVFVDWSLLGLLLVGVVGFLLGLLAWRMGCVGFYVHRLGQEFDCRVQSQHPDGAGGLGVLGELCFLNALIVIVPSTFLGAWRILIANVPAFRARYDYLTTWFDGLLVVTFFLAIIAFVIPLYGVHRAMSREKTRRQRDLDLIGNELDRLTQRIRRAAEDGDSAAVGTLTDQRSVLAAVYASEQDVPTWPVNTSLTRKYLVAQIVPLLSLSKIVDAITSRFLGSL